jgi:LPXTG-site transpeptidase (sortase) family protein
MTLSRFPWTRVTAVVAATLAGGALAAYLVVARNGTGGGAAAGLVSPTTAAGSDPLGPAAVRSFAPPPPSTPDPAAPSLHAAPATQPADAVSSAPTRVVVSRLGVDMTVEPQGVTPDGQMALPKTPDVAGWYRYGSAPDDPAGATVLAAHVDSKSGIGPFVRLGGARAGDEVDVWVGGERHAYRVTQVFRVDKTRLDGDGLFAVSGPPRLHLVTCTGDYVPGSGYTQNLVVIADRW